MTNHDSIQLQASYYDQRWGDRSFVGALEMRRSIEILRAIADANLERPRIIELGCGTGWLTVILNQFGPATGVELSPVAVAQASKRHPHVAFLHADLTRWDYPREQFDVVVSHEVIEHLEDQAAHMAMARGLLRRGGRLVLTTPNATVVRAMPKEQQAAWCSQPIENWLTVAEVGQLARAHGFRVRSLSTLIAGFGSKGAYRVVNSTKVSNILGRMGFRETYDFLRLRLGLGLHIVLSAEKL